MVYNKWHMDGDNVTSGGFNEKAIEDFLVDLYRVYKATFLYPSEHPSLLTMYVKPFKDILAVLDETEKMVISYRRGEGFNFNNFPAARRYPVVNEMGEALFVRKVRSVFFLKGVKLTELRSLLEAITAEPRAIEKAGGCEAFLLSRGVRNIWFNEIDYEKILEKQKEEGEKASRIEATAGREGSGAGEGIYDFLAGEEEGGVSSHEDISHAEENPLQNRQVAEGRITDEAYPEDTDDLIEKWRGAVSSYAEFEQIGNLLVGRFFEAGSQGEIAAISKILNAYLDMSEQIKKEDFIQFISGRLDQMASAKEPIELLLGQACIKGAEDTALIETIVRLRGRAAGRVADKLASEEDVHARKILNNILVGMGKEIIPQLLERLGDERWYVVRNTVRNLGEIGGERGVEDALMVPLGHKDPRVRKETVRALSMIRGPQTINLLKSALNDSDGGVVELAVVSLGVLEDEGSVQSIIDIIEKREDSGVKREAVRALGRIGSRKAISYLIKTLEKKGWFSGKRDDELKVMCISALADIGTPDAVRALEAGLSSSREAVRNACEEELRRIQHG